MSTPHRALQIFTTSLQVLRNTYIWSPIFIAVLIGGTFLVRELFGGADYRKDFAMARTPDKIKGATIKAAGGMREGVGKVIDNDEMKDKDNIQRARCAVQEAVGRVKYALKEKLG